MYPKPFQYFAPSTLQEALELLGRYGEEARVLAGGQSLIPLMKLRLASPAYLIDLNRIPNMAYIEERDGHIAIGAMTRHAELEASPLLRERLPLMHDAARVIADPQVRNLGTIGGSLAEADPAGDWAPVVLALGGQVRCASPRGERTLKAEDLFIDAYTTALEPDEVLTEVQLPLPPPGSTGVYLKLARKAGDFAVVSVALQLTLEGEVVQGAGIGLGAVGPTAIRPPAAEEALRGRLDEAAVERAAGLAADAAQPFSDLRGSAEYKRAMVHLLLKRAVALCLRRSRGEAVEAGYV
jgi:carbon-monoxide dehydrogenase medium subunit